MSGYMKTTFVSEDFNIELKVEFQAEMGEDDFHGGFVEGIILTEAWLQVGDKPLKLNVGEVEEHHDLWKALKPFLESEAVRIMEEEADESKLEAALQRMEEDPS